MDVALALVIAYLLGTFPTAVVVARAFSGGQVDIRQSGTGNPGAMNTMAVLGKKAGAVVLLIDIGKAVLACVIARIIAGPTAAEYAGSAAVIGHCFPVWSKFRGGGKGVASSGGQCLATFPVYTPVAIAVAIFSARSSSFAMRTYLAGLLAGAAWVVTATVWVVFDLPNAWGPKPTLSLAVASAISSAVMIYKFQAARDREPQPTPPTAL